MTIDYRTARWVAAVLALLMLHVAGEAWHPVLGGVAAALALPLLWFVGYATRPLFRALANWCAVGTALVLVWGTPGDGPGWPGLAAGLVAAAAVFVGFPLSQTRLAGRPGGLSRTRAY